MANPSQGRTVPLIVKLGLTAFVAVLIPIYYAAYGLWHFLWLSDVALFVTLIALWRESRLLNSMMVIGVLSFETVWMIDFFAGLVFGVQPLGATDYMFDTDQPAVLRALSLFHLVLPVIWVWLGLKWGYDRRAAVRQTCLFWGVILGTYFLSDPQDNINWVFSPIQHGWEWMPQPLWVGLYIAGVPSIVYWPLHRLCLRWARAEDE